MGCVTQIGEQGWNVGRMAVLAAGWPVAVAATTVDRQCGSSMQTNFNAAAAVMAGQLDLVVSAGVEMMSRVPMGSNGGSISERVTERHEIVMQGTSAELLAEEWKLSREALDAYSLESHRRALAASDSGRFDREIVPIELPDGAPFAVDEAPRRETSAEALAALKPAFQPDGVVTAGNSSQIVDGAAAVLIASEAARRALGLEPRARFVSFGLAGVDPTRMLHGNPQAMQKALAKAGLTLDDMSVIEVNEAFASVVLQTVAGPRPRRAAGRRQPERRRHLARPSARRDRRADHRDACLASSSAATRATASRRCASASAWRSPAWSSASEDRPRRPGAAAYRGRQMAMCHVCRRTCSRASATAPGAGSGAIRPSAWSASRWSHEAGAVRVVDAYETCARPGSTRTVRRVA